MEKPISLTHQHLLSVMLTELQKRNSPENVIRVLDVGCGDGELIRYLTKNFGYLSKGKKVEVYGFDVSDHQVQKDGFFEDTITKLTKDIPDVQWDSRLKLIKQEDEWPYESDHFDCIISNQVCEHIPDHKAFFQKIYKHLRPGAFSCHLFPVKNYILEGHSLIPFAHKFYSHDNRKAYIRLMSQLGFGGFVQKSGSFSREQFSEDWSIKLAHDCNYLFPKELINFAHGARLLGSFRYTKDYYFSKLNSVLKRKPKYSYKSNWITDSFWFFFCKYLASVTLFLEKKSPRGIEKGQRH